MVLVMSRGWMVSSSKVPASAGQMPLGGSYCGATETPGSGSRPTEYQRANITASVSSGRNTMGLLPRNQPNFVSADGGLSTFCFKYTATTKIYTLSLHGALAP